MENHVNVTATSVVKLPAVGPETDLDPFEWGLTGTSDPNESGVFKFKCDLNRKIHWISGASVTEGLLGEAHVGDALFQIISAQWKGSVVTVVVRELNRAKLLEEGVYKAYTAKLPFTVGLIGRYS